MKASRKRPKSARHRLFGLLFGVATLMPTSIGYQDLAALIASQPAVTERWRQHVRSATVNLHAATFSFPRPIGAAIPDPSFAQLASVDPRAVDLTGAVPLHAPLQPEIAAPKHKFPIVDRRMKGDKLNVKPAPAQPEAPKAREPEGKKDQASLLSASTARMPAQEQPGTADQSRPNVARKGDRAPLSSQAAQAAAPVEGPATEIADLESQRADVHEPLLPQKPAAPAVRAPKRHLAPSETSSKAEEKLPSEPAPDAPASEAVEMLEQLVSASQSARVYFGSHAIGIGGAGLQPWQPDEVPTVLAAPHVDPEIKRTAIEPASEAPAQAETPGETIAPKGEVTGEGKRPRTPAERLNLTGAARAKHEKCLANAIYFEARGEVERGQMAVAQVVLNRAFSGYYPGNVCDVVYQNAHRHLACQFTFACDNVKDVVRDPKAWALATRIARDALDGKFWLPEVGKATHYHATYVNPWWVRTMTKHSKLGIHIFYRPKRWGSGEEIPVWGDPLGVTGSTAGQKREADTIEERRADAEPAKRRSIFDPVDEIQPGG